MEEIVQENQVQGPMPQVVWIDPNMSNEENQKTFEHIKASLNDAFYNSEDKSSEILTFVDNIQEGMNAILKSEKCIIISAGKLGENVFAKDLADKALDEENVEAMCVFCGKQSVEINE